MLAQVIESKTIKMNRINGNNFHVLIVDNSKRFIRFIANREENHIDFRRRHLIESDLNVEIKYTMCFVLLFCLCLVDERACTMCTQSPYFIKFAAKHVWSVRELHSDFPLFVFHYLRFPF